MKPGESATRIRVPLTTLGGSSLHSAFVAAVAPHGAAFWPSNKHATAVTWLRHGQVRWSKRRCASGLGLSGLGLRCHSGCVARRLGRPVEARRPQGEGNLECGRGRPGLWATGNPAAGPARRPKPADRCWDRLLGMSGGRCGRPIAHRSGESLTVPAGCTWHLGVGQWHPGLHAHTHQSPWHHGAYAAR